MNREELRLGKLSSSDISKLRTILNNGFKSNSTIGEMETNIRENIKLKNVINKEDKILVKAAQRPNMIARTETVRLANKGLVDTYIENDIERVRFMAAVSERTCPVCIGLDGNVLSIKEVDEGLNQPPIHVGCRCYLLSIAE